MAVKTSNLIWIISPPDTSTLPEIPQDKVIRCIEYGHCEVFCPTKALTRDHETGSLDSPEKDSITPESLTPYLMSHHSIRNYPSESVDKDILMKILEIARYAPTRGDGQPVEWLIMRDSDEIRKVSGLTMGRTFGHGCRRI